MRFDWKAARKLSDTQKAIGLLGYCCMMVLGLIIALQGDRISMFIGMGGMALYVFGLIVVANFQQRHS